MLVGTETRHIVEETNQLLDNPSAFMEWPKHPIHSVMGMLPSELSKHCSVFKVKLGLLKADNLDTLTTGDFTKYPNSKDISKMRGLCAVNNIGM